jgi:hypothetical protein
MADSGACEDDNRVVSLWTHYILFEIEYGGVVVNVAVVACPRNAEVCSECVLAEVRFGDDACSRAAFDRTLVDFADDKEAMRQFTLEVPICLSHGERPINAAPRVATRRNAHGRAKAEDDRACSHWRLGVNACRAI